MKQREHENPRLAARLREGHYRNLSQFYEEHFGKDPVISFDTVRRAIYEDHQVNYPTLILIMDALGFSPLHASTAPTSGWSFPAQSNRLPIRRVSRPLSSVPDSVSA